MDKKTSDFMDKLHEIDKHAEDGVYCVEPSEDDKRVFAEHARIRKEVKMSEYNIDWENRGGAPLSPEEIEQAKQLEKMYGIRLLFNNRPLIQYYKKNVQIVDTSGRIWAGKVNDYIYPEDNEPEEQSIVIDTLDGQIVEFYGHDIKDIKIIPESFKVRYISDKNSVFFKQGEVYEAFLPKDNPSGDFYAFHLPDMDEPGDYALPASRFERIGE